MTRAAPIDLVQRLSLKRNIAFSIVGRGYYAVTQFLIIMIAAQLGTLEDVGVLTLAAAIVTPLFFLATMGTRDVLTVDDLDRFSRADFVFLRLIGSIAALVMSVILTIAFYGDGGLLILGSVVGFSLVKFVGAQAAMNHAMFQRAERLDFMAASIFVRGTAGLIAFGVVFWQTRNLPLALICEAGAWILTYWFIDKQLLVRLGLNTSFASLADSNLRKIGVLALWVLPIGLALWMMRTAFSVPPFLLEHFHGLEAVGLFGALAYVHTALSMLANAMGNASAARLRRCIREQRTRDFWRIARKLTTTSFALGLTVTVGAWLFGSPLLTWAFGEDYAQPALFTIIVAASSLMLIASPLTTSIIASQVFIWRVVISGSSLIAAVFAALVLIPAHGVFGAAWTFMAASATYLIVTFIACGFLFGGQSKGVSHE